MNEPNGVIAAMSKADDYRRRATAATKSARRRKNKGDRVVSEKKARALTDMADNEDWLDGKSKVKA
jgi:hypothetical protein